jgi:bifunctional non-homologous end joining protein LigD
VPIVRREPEGQTGAVAERRRFVIQQHDATRLHWDLRLEHGGVLRSWALPRGIPWSPEENRLAVATEDHSLDFLDREGHDADPGYGTGRLTTWDRGTYETHKWEDGKVVVTLDGSRVAGRYALFSMRGTRDWLIHRMDPPADEDRAPVPFGVPPMRASGGELPEGAGWAVEPQWHGVRALVTDDTGRVVVTAADGTDLSLRFPEVRRIGRALGHREVILDGVIVPVDGTGRIRHDRAGLARRLRISSDSGARNAGRTAPVVFTAFDVLWVEGRPVTGLPWELRRRQLDDLRLDGPGWRTTPVLEPDEVIAHLDGGPGVVAKRLGSTYRPGATTPDWIQVA